MTTKSQIFATGLGAMDLSGQLSASWRFPVLAATVLALVPSPLWADPPGHDIFRKDVEPFLKAFCVRCHGPEKQSARIRFDGLNGFRLDDLHLWTAVHEAVSKGDMPPKDRPQPSAAEQKRVLDWITWSHALARTAQGSGSRRRLNRREFGQTLADLLGLPLDLEKSLPGDRTVDGFDTVAAGLQDAAPSVQATMAVTRKVLDSVVFLEEPPARSRVAAVNFPIDKGRGWGDGRQLGMVFSGNSGAKLIEDRGWLISPGAGEANYGLAFRVMNAPPKSLVRVKLQVASLAGPDVAPPTLEFRASNRLRSIEITEAEDRPRTLEFFLFVQDENLRVFPQKDAPPNTELSFVVLNRHALPFDPAPGDKEIAKRVQSHDLTAPVSWLLISAVEMEVDYRHHWLSERERAEIPANDDGAGIVIERFAERAYRRPLTVGERTKLRAFYDRRRNAKEGLDQAIRTTLELALASPAARSLDGVDDPDPVRRQYALASRLSYGLLGTLPDRQLLDLAAAGKLNNPAVLDAQVDRLLDDPRTQSRFVERFAEMWLDLGQPMRVVQDDVRNDLYKFQEPIRTAMKAEPAAYIGEMLRSNLPAEQLVASDWAMLNDRLAFHYGYPRLLGGNFRKVATKKDDPRGGGLLGQAGIMSMTTWMGSNWPIYRGAWMLRHLLDDPPPPPPLEVPELNPNAENLKGKSFREVLRIHQDNALCVVCHKKMDPLGFAFQNFDVGGRWREVEHESYTVYQHFSGAVVYQKYGKPRPVDPVGQLPRGETFADFPEFKKKVRDHYTDDVVRALLKRYFLYFAGRQPDVADLAAIREIMTAHRQNRYPMKDLLKAVVRSRALLER